MERQRAHHDKLTMRPHLYFLCLTYMSAFCAGWLEKATDTNSMDTANLNMCPQK
jgi:hypothetical protein